MIVVLTLILAYVATVALAWGMQRRLIYPAPPGARDPALPGGSLLRIAGPSGSTVFALHVPAPPGSTTVVHLHGNAEQLADLSWLADQLRTRALGFFAVEYPGYGLAGAGAPSEQAIDAAAEAALRHLQGSLRVPNENILLLGQSLGSGPAVEMARRGYGARLVLLSPFTSISDVGARTFPFLPVRLLVRDRFDNAAKAPSIQLPVLIIHGTSDEVIPFDMGVRLSSLFPRAQLRRLEGAHHNDVFDWEQGTALNEIAAFAQHAPASSR
jgi:alpha-beta hydrolase superfamily lysophospholipase